MWVKDPKTKEPSVTLTLLVSGFCVAVLKLVVSGISVGPATLAPFTGGDFAAVVASLGAIYAARKHTDKEQK
jgi:hypothetical protein